MLLVIFLCEHCPYVKHVHSELVKLGKDYGPKGVGIVGISANDVEHYPDDSPENLKKMVATLQLNYSICYDETQAVAKAYRAACTPEFYLFNQELELVYRGQLDDSRPKNGLPVTGKDLRNALDKTLAGEAVSLDQKPGMGCNVKWKPGQEPDYFGH
jgi:thiol-disulfide isomerase/thioredoxin